MIYIEKQKEPRSLTKFKKQPFCDYSTLDANVKTEIKEHLCEEQHYLCAYCMRKISVESMTIEHYSAQNPSTNPEEAHNNLDYKNMLGVCNGGRGLPYDKQTCDAHKGNIELCVDPLNPYSINKILYSTNGKITSKNPEIDKDLNETLNLNCKKPDLSANRKAALDSLRRNLAKTYGSKHVTKENAEKEKEKLTSHNKYTEYIGILLWYLNNRK